MAVPINPTAETQRAQRKVHRFLYDTDQKVLRVEFEFIFGHGQRPAHTAKAARAVPFRFFLFKIRRAFWGLRAAAEAYRRLLPDDFAAWVRKEGGGAPVYAIEQIEDFKNLGLTERLTQAGWEPIPHAITSDDEVPIERFGSFKEGNLHFVVLNQSDSPKGVGVDFDVDELRLMGEGLAAELVANEVLEFEPEEFLLSVHLSLRPKEAKLLWLTEEKNFVDYLVGRAQQHLERAAQAVGQSATQTAIQEALGTLKELTDFRQPEQKRMAQAMKLQKNLTELVSVLKEAKPPATEAIQEVSSALRFSAALAKLGLGISLDLISPTRAVPGETLRLPLLVYQNAKLPIERATATLTLEDSAGNLLRRGEARWAQIPPRRRSYGLFVLDVPPEADVGAMLSLRLSLEGELSGQPVRFTDSRPLAIVEKFSMTARQSGPEPTLGISLTNRASTPLRGAIEVSLPQGWSTEAAQQSVLVGAHNSKEFHVTLKPPPDAPMDYHSIRATFRDERGGETTQDAAFLYTPPKTNLLANASFEESDGKLAANWQSYPKEGYEVDTKEKRSGARSIRCSLKDPSQFSGAVQQKELNRDRPIPLIIHGLSKAHRVLSSADGDYSLFVDITDADGKTLPAHASFEGGTHDWQWSQKIIALEKPIKQVRFHALFRRRRGTVWFDDLYLGELIIAKKNLAPDAKTQVDSSLEGHDEKPLKDGVVGAAISDDPRYMRQATRGTAWVSAETETPHWIELSFAKPLVISKVVVWWAQEGGKFLTSRRCLVQHFEAGKWVEAASLLPAPNQPFSVFEFAPLTTRRLRIFQPQGSGSLQRPNLMAVSEVEVY